VGGGLASVEGIGSSWGRDRGADAEVMESCCCRQPRLPQSLTAAAQSPAGRQDAEAAIALTIFLSQTADLGRIKGMSGNHRKGLCSGY
jgi:hypothetical protein